MAGNLVNGRWIIRSTPRNGIRVASTPRLTDYGSFAHSHG
jgi:hypothetical protein